MMDILFSILIIFYCLSVMYLWLGWERLPVTLNDHFLPSVSILIPIRNEATNILLLLKDLQHQTYDGRYEVLIIDDHSEDNSYTLVKEFIKVNGLYKSFTLEQNTGKKAAISEGIKQSSGEIIITVDGDCRASASWIKAMVSAFDEDTQLVSGPVVVEEGGSLFSNMQSIEFASLIGSGAALIGWQSPIMANGANLAFRKAAFIAVDGFAGNQDTASGDDVFLLHKIAKQFPNSVAFAKQEGATIKTKAKGSIKSFIGQRIRWASKWKAYSDLMTKSTAVFMFLVSLSILLYPMLVWFNSASLFLWINLIIIKLFFDYFFIRQITRFLGTNIYLISFVLLQLVYPFYVVFTALFSLRKSYVWKGRKVK